MCQPPPPRVQRQLAGVDVWTAPFGDLKPSLISSGQLLSAWVDEARTITADWAAGIDGNGHFWEGSAFAHPLCTALRERLDQVRHVCGRVQGISRACYA